MVQRSEMIDFSRSFCHYVPRGHTFMVRIQIECRCEVFDQAAGSLDEYMLGVRTQTGLRTDPPSDALDPGYDFWMIFSRQQVFIKRVHTSSYNHNPSRMPLSDFASSGWHVARSAATPLRSAAEVSRAVRAFQPIVARTEFRSADGPHGYAIEYPVKWADGDDEGKPFRVETGPVLLLDLERARVRADLTFDDFQWAYLDYHSFDQVRCFLERPTSILSGATYVSSPFAPRRTPPLTDEAVAAIENRLYTGWEPPIPTDALRRLLQTDHYSAVEHRAATTTLYALGS